MKKVALRQVENLKRDLLAEVVVQKEVSHLEEDWYTDNGSSTSNNYSSRPVMVKVVDVPEIMKPDMQAQETARQQLQQFRDSSEWNSVRRAATKALAP